MSDGLNAEILATAAGKVDEAWLRLLPEDDKLRGSAEQHQRLTVKFEWISKDKTRDAFVVSGKQLDVLPQFLESGS